MDQFCPGVPVPILGVPAFGPWLIQMQSAKKVRFRKRMRSIRATIPLVCFLAGTALAQIQLRPLFDLPGETSDPSLSPDGTTVAFAWYPPAVENWGIYIRPMSGSMPPRLFAGNDESLPLSPKWSPDGKWIAFTRAATPRSSALVVKALEGSAELSLGAVCADREVAWTADGRSVIAPSNGDPDSNGNCELTVFPIDPGQSVRQLGSLGADPALSTDGRTLTFVRGRELWLLPLTREGRTGGAAKLLVRETGRISAPAWVPGTNEIVYLLSEDRSLIRRVAARPGSAPRDAGNIDGEFNLLSPTGKGGHLLADVETYDNSVWKIDLQSPNPHFEKLRTLGWNVSDLRVSPDGRTVLYALQARGHSELYTSNLDGSASRHILRVPNLHTDQLEWSPDGKQIAYTASPHQAQIESLQLFVASVNGGSSRRVAEQFDDVYRVDWSRDGKALYLTTGSNGPWTIWKLNLTDNQLTKISQVAALPVELFDDNLIYQRLNLVPFSLLRTPLTGGSEEHLFDNALFFAIGTSDVYVIRQDSKPPTREGLNLYRFSLSTRTLQFITNAGFGTPALQLSPDARTLYAERHEPPHRRVMIVENLH
jgi:Tol biopolymer transport system component